MSNKYNRYEEPEMPESLRKLLTDDFSDSRRPGKRKSKKRPGKAPKKTNKSKKNLSKSKKRPVAPKKPINKKTKTDRNKSARPSVSPAKKPRPKVQPKASRPVKPIAQEATRKIPVIRDENGRKVSQDRARRQRLYEDESTKRIPVSQTRKTNKKVHKKAVNRRPTKKRKKKKSRISIKHIFSAIIYAFLLVIGFIFTGGNKKKYVSKEKRKKLDQNFYRILSGVSMGIIIIIMVAFAISPKAEKSISENRTLQQKPKMTMQSLLTGKYSKDYGKYLSDQFPARESMIKGKAKFDLLLGRKELNGVYICKDGYLMEGFTEASPEVTDAKIKAINNFVSQNPKLNVSMMLVPNKVEIYKNLLPKNTPSDSQKAYLDKVKEKVDKKVNFVNLITPFNRIKNSTQLYYKTDHHWTTDGAYKGYEEFSKSRDISPAQEKSFTKSLATDKFLGSLYYKNGAQIGEPENIILYLKEKPYPLLVKYYDTKEKVTTLYDADKLKGKDKYEIFTGGNHSQIKIRTNVKTKRKLLLIKDSYANAMLPFLINDFAEINVVDLRYYTGTMADILNNNEVTDVLILYNVNTFNTDPSILNIYDPDYHSQDDESTSASEGKEKKSVEESKKIDKTNDTKPSEDKADSNKKSASGKSSESGQSSTSKKNSDKKTDEKKDVQ
nr:DHHW family protein [uncultured Peptostreptococcus sp.]